MAATYALEPPPSSPAPVYPDIVEDIPSHHQIQNRQQQEWLRFTTAHVNIGAGNLQIRGGGLIAPCTIDRISHDPWTVAQQELLDAAGNIVATHPGGRRAVPPRAQPLAPVRGRRVRSCAATR